MNQGIQELPMLEEKEREIVARFSKVAKVARFPQILVQTPPGGGHGGRRGGQRSASSVIRPGEVPGGRGEVPVAPVVCAAVHLDLH